MKLDIVSPEKVYYSGEVLLVTLPGESGIFTILENHAPIISALNKGIVSYKTMTADNSLHINGGFAEVNNNKVIVCIEKAD